MTDKPEALRLADDRPNSINDDLYQWAIDAEDELRRLVAENEKFREADVIFAGRQRLQNDQFKLMVELLEQRDELLATLKKLEYSSDGYIKRYPEEAEVNAAIARAEVKQ